MIRLHEGSSLTALPIFLPDDPAIPVGEIPASPQLHAHLRRRAPAPAAREDRRSPAVVVIAYATVIGITLSLLALLAWSLHRLAFPPRPQPRRDPRKGLAPTTPALQR